jgi:hypothetical protein
MQGDENHKMLILIKLLHTAIWIFFNIVLIYLFYAAFSDRIDYLFWLGIGAFLMEFIILLMYKWSCPLTFWARKYSNSTMDNFDIYLPNWLARHNKTIYSILMGVLFGILVFKKMII